MYGARSAIGEATDSPDKGEGTDSPEKGKRRSVMYAPPFDYYRASSVADAHRLMASHPGAKLLAGGHSLVPLLKLRLAAPPAVVDIGRIPDLRGVTRQGSEIRIGALTTHAELAASPDLRLAAPALAEAAAMIGDPTVRNRGTIGGNVAHADPASDLPTVLVALDARITGSARYLPNSSSPAS